MELQALLTNYLQNRKQYVVFNNHESDLTEITTGVPQGSILGPLLFSIIILIVMKLYRFALLFFDGSVITGKFCVGVPVNNQSIYLSIYQHNYQ